MEATLPCQPGCASAHMGRHECVYTVWERWKKWSAAAGPYAKFVRSSYSWCRCCPGQTVRHPYHNT